MKQKSPHYLLFSEASYAEDAGKTWRFVLQDVESKRRLAVSDEEPGASGERLQLLAVVRGLEALDGPARVTLVTRSRYVNRGIKHGIAEWRANEWHWERFGRIVPVKDSDLWKRVDRALLFHEVECQAWQFEEIVETARVAVEPVKVSTPSYERQAARIASESQTVSRTPAMSRAWPRRLSPALSRQRPKRWQDSLLRRAVNLRETWGGWGATAQPAIQAAAS